jgi:hypothetical protein
MACIEHAILPDFGLCPSSGILRTKESTTFRELDVFPSSDEGWETLRLLGRAVIGVNYNRPNGTCVSKPSPEDGDRFDFRNAVF